MCLSKIHKWKLILSVIVSGGEALGTCSVLMNGISAFIKKTSQRSCAPSSA